MKPTIGRVVLFHPQVGLTRAALIAYVHSDTLVNLAVFNENGASVNATSVVLIGQEDPKPEFSPYCEFPPYQERKPQKQDCDLTLTMGPDVAAALKRIIVRVDQQIALELAGQP
jgi:hypothetical protein